MGKKIISINKYQINKLKERYMLFLIIIFCTIIASLFWRFYVIDQDILEAPIAKSQNIRYTNNSIRAIEGHDIASQIQDAKGRPVLFYLYTTWCDSCEKNFPIFNEIVREFQNTELKVIAIAIDADITGRKLAKFLDIKGDLYFHPHFLSSRDGFGDVLKEFNIKYSGRIPFTTLLSAQGDVLLKYSGSRPPRKLRLEIKKELLAEK